MVSPLCPDTLGHNQQKHLPTHHSFLASSICIGGTSESSKQWKPGQGPEADEAPVRCRWEPPQAENWFFFKANLGALLETVRQNYKQQRLKGARNGPQREYFVVWKACMNAIQYFVVWKACMNAIQYFVVWTACIMLYNHTVSQWWECVGQKLYRTMNNTFLGVGGGEGGGSGRRGGGGGGVKFDDEDFPIWRFAKSGIPPWGENGSLMSLSLKTSLGRPSLTNIHDWSVLSLVYLGTSLQKKNEWQHPGSPPPPPHPPFPNPPPLLSALRFHQSCQV